MSAIICHYGSILRLKITLVIDERIVCGSAWSHAISDYKLFSLCKTYK